MADRCEYRTAAMNIDGWGYAECDLPGDHAGDHHWTAIVHDGGALRSATKPSLSASRPAPADGLLGPESAATPAPQGPAVG